MFVNTHKNICVLSPQKKTKQKIAVRFYISLYNTKYPWFLYSLFVKPQGLYINPSSICLTNSIP